MRRRTAFAGFTLVELLVVIAIIGILVSLLMPAVQAARESGRQATCANSVKQMANACIQHETAQGWLPTGGWGWNWGGDSDRGFSKKQPGGWHYNILPYMDQVALHDQGAMGSPDPTNNGAPVTASSQTQVLMLTQQTPVALFNCPHRRRCLAYPYVRNGSYFDTNITPNTGENVGRSDYGANGGDQNPSIPAGPGSLAAGDGLTDSSWNSTISSDVFGATGVSFVRSQITTAMITDGPSHTYLIGERYADPDFYYNGQACDDDQGWDQGYDFDTYRWTGSAPMQDVPGFGGCDINFGSAHAVTFNMAFCDGSVHAIKYNIDPTTHQRLGNRMDHQAIDPTKWQ